LQITLTPRAVTLLSLATYSPLSLHLRLNVWESHK
jgi:hypothetical protein